MQVLWHDERYRKKSCEKDVEFEGEVDRSYEFMVNVTAKGEEFLFFIFGPTTGK